MDLLHRVRNGMTRKLSEYDTIHRLKQLSERGLADIGITRDEFGPWPGSPPESIRARPTSLASWRAFERAKQLTPPDRVGCSPAWHAPPRGSPRASWS